MIEDLAKVIDNFTQYAHTFKLDLMISVVFNLVIITILFKCTNIFINKVKRHICKSESSSLSEHLIPILEKTIKFLILFFIVTSFLQSNGYSINSLIAGLGITGLAIGFAAQQTVADFFGTLTIITDRMYTIGDYIKIDTVEGIVEDVNLLSTKIRTLDDFLIYVPNNNVSGAVVVNMSKSSKRRIYETFSLTYDTSDENIQKAIDIINNICAKNKNLHKDISVFVEALAQSSIDIRLIAYAKTKSTIELAKIRSVILCEIVKEFRNENISFAFPSQSVYIEKK